MLNSFDHLVQHRTAKLDFGLLQVGHVFLRRKNANFDSHATTRASSITCQNKRLGTSLSRTQQF